MRRFKGGGGAFLGSKSNSGGNSCGDAGTAEPHIKHTQPQERGDKVERAVLGAGFEDDDGRKDTDTGQMTTGRAL